MADTLEITKPADVSVSGGRSNWDGATATTFGFTGYDGIDWGSDDQHILDAILQTGDPYSGGLNGKGVWFLLDAGDSGNGIVTYGFDQGTAVFSLNGAPPISFNSLPSGFLITVLRFQINGFNQRFGVNPPGVVSLFINGLEATPTITEPSPDLFKYEFDVDVLDLAFSGTSISGIDFIGIDLELVLQTVDDGSTSSSIPAAIEWVFTGEFTIFAQTFTLEIPSNPVNTADPITVISDPNDPNAMDMEQIQTIDITYIDANGDPQTINVPSPWITQDENLLIFALPIIPIDAFVITIIVTSTQFVGSVPLGQLTTIYFISASGIYKLVTDKRNDTLYIEESLPNTIDVKIPDPFAKGNFIGSS